MESDGATLRQHLEVVVKRFGIIPPELAQAPKCPPMAAHVWRYFSDLSRGRPVTEFGEGRITRLDIRLWEEDEGLILEPWERRAILLLDEIYLTRPTRAPAAPTPPPS
ncbi:phage tail assembly chaperone [Phenylobacterium conjunctum]|uniref:Uncharacterized protein n=1 Tax=Phenylobacterium conjunctum TaxID=1298959 RepID=A0ABW3T273_9CAUL